MVSILEKKWIQKRERIGHINQNVTFKSINIIGHYRNVPNGLITTTSQLLIAPGLDFNYLNSTGVGN